MYAIYARQSADRADSISIETQIDLCKKIIPENQSYEIYADRGYSGSNTNRPAFIKLLNLCKVRQGMKIVTYKLDRISRSLLDFVLLLEELQKNGAELISCTESFCSSSEMGILIMKLLIMFAEMERKNIRLRVRDNYYSRAQKGYYLGGYPPFGYRKITTLVNSQSTGGYEIIPHEAEYVKKIYNLFLKGNSINSICRSLNSAGVTTKKNKPWTATAVSRILRNPFYAEADKLTLAYHLARDCELICSEEAFDGKCGIVCLHGSAYRSDVKIDNFTGGTLSVGRHRPLISSADWLNTQNKLRKLQFKNNGGGTKSYLSGLVKCAFSGTKYTITLSGANVYFYCRKKKVKGCSELCKGKKLVTKAERIEKIVEEILKSYLLELSSHKVTLPSDSRKLLEARLCATEKKLAALQQMIVDSEDDDSTPTDDFFLETADKLTQKKNYLRKKIAAEVEKEQEKCYTVLKEAALNFHHLPFATKKYIAAKLIEGIYLGDMEIEVLLSEGDL